MMKIILLAALSLAAVLTVGPATFAQGRSGQASPTPSSNSLPSGDKLFELGKVKGSTYSNEYFGISFTAPKGWIIFDLETMKAMRESARALFRDEKDARVKRELEATLERTTPLFSASKLPPGTTGSFNTTLVCAAERIPTAVVKTPRDYYTIMLHSMKLSQGVTIEVVNHFHLNRICSKNFVIYTLKVTSHVGIVIQKQIIAIKDSYAFGIVFTYLDESDTKAFDEMLNSIRAM